MWHQRIEIFLHFMWLDSIFKSYPELISLCFTTWVLFGLSCSPFLLNDTVKSHLLKYTQFTDIKEFVEKLLHLHVDYSVKSFNKLNDCIKFCKVSESCFADIGSDLRKWKSNDYRFDNFINSLTRVVSV